jgi:hypothetical protein
MKKIFTIAVMALMLSSNVIAQDTHGKWTLNTRAWTTNYYTSAIFNGVGTLLEEFIYDDEEERDESQIINAIIPDFDLVFPVGMGKKGFGDLNNIYGPYHRAFGNPFKHMGDYGFGFDVSYKRSRMGFYAGAFYKSQELAYKLTDKNLRGFYFQPRAGIIIGRNKKALEAGVFYDIATRCKGMLINDKGVAMEAEKDMIKSGVGLDFALSTTNEKETSKFVLEFSMPLHNFLNDGHKSGALIGMKRKVGYIMVTERVVF